jgi:hypothetical protein
MERRADAYELSSRESSGDENTAGSLLVRNNSVMKTPQFFRFEQRRGLGDSEPDCDEVNIRKLHRDRRKKGRETTKSFGDDKEGAPPQNEEGRYSK